MQCQLNDTLYNLQSIGSTPLAGASFYSTDQDSTSASSHVIAVITKNVTATQAEQILTMLTHNSTGARIGNNVTVSSTSVYLMHLPNDVLSSIPTSVTNSGLGGAPNFFDPLDVISDIANLVFDFLIWIATGGVLLLWVHLVIMGLEVIANLISSAISAIEAAVDVIVDTINAFVDWMVNTISGMLDSKLSSECEEGERTVDSCMQRIAVCSNHAVDEYNDTGIVSPKTQEQYQESVEDLSAYYFVIGIIVVFIISIVYEMANVWGFIVGTIIAVIMGYLIEMTGASSSQSQEIESDGSIADSAGILSIVEVMGLAADPGDNSESAQYWRMVEEATSVLLDWHAFLAAGILLVCSKVKSQLSVMGLVFAAISLTIGTSNYVINCPAIGWIAFSLSMVGLGISILDVLIIKGLLGRSFLIADYIAFGLEAVAAYIAVDLIRYHGSG